MENNFVAKVETRGAKFFDILFFKKFNFYLIYFSLNFINFLHLNVNN